MNKHKDDKDQVFSFGKDDVRIITARDGVNMSKYPIPIPSGLKENENFREKDNQENI